MITISDLSKPVDVGSNIISINHDKIDFKNSKVIFKGEGNKLYIENGTRINNSRIYFYGSNSHIYISKNASKQMEILCNINSNCELYIGRSSRFHGAIRFMIDESCGVYIGDDCMFSFGIIFRTSDPHLIFDTFSNKRINKSKSIIVGDHCWIGQNCTILKGSYIGSGSIVGANSLTTNKKYQSNAVYAGNPAKIVRSNVYWRHECVQNWNEEKNLYFRSLSNKDLIFNGNRSFDLDNISIYNLKYNKDHNRFFLPKEKVKSIFSRSLLSSVFKKIINI